MTGGETVAARRRLPQVAADVALHPVTLWLAFILVHFLLLGLGVWAPGRPFGDLETYSYWVLWGRETGEWVGIDTIWVYPIGALALMLLAAIPGIGDYVQYWVSMVMFIDAIAFAVLTVLGPRRDDASRRGVALAAWWWIGFLALLGPVAIGRIDAVTVAVALMALVVLAARPFLAGVLLAVATWIKVWPAALVAAVVLAVRGRLRVIAGGVAVTAVVVLTVAAFGGLRTLFSFLTAQADRGLQIEAVFATPWMWAALAGSPSAGEVYFDREILTFQLSGSGPAVTAAATTPLLVVAILLLLGLGFVALRRGAAVGELLPPLALALVLAMIVLNKVGSPQFAAWLAVPVVFGLVLAARGDGPPFTVPASLSLAIALLTQTVYPYLYTDLLLLNPVLLILLTARNLLYLVLLAWAVAALVGLLVRRQQAAPAAIQDVLSR